LHLAAILPRLEEVAAYDPAARELIRNWNFAVQFQLPGGNPACTLVFKDGALTAVADAAYGSKVTLTFPNAKALNETFLGVAKHTPRPNVRGLFYARKLKKLDRLTDRLEYYLKASEEQLKADGHFEFAVKVRLYVLASGVGCVGEHDPEMKEVVAGLPDGTLEIRVKDGPSARLEITSGKFHFTKGGDSQQPSAVMELADPQTAWQLLEDKLDVFAAVGGGSVKLSGMLPLVDGVGLVMTRLGTYLA